MALSWMTILWKNRLRGEGMLFEKIGILDAQCNYVPDCYVGVTGKRIDYIGKEPPKGAYNERYNGKGKLLMTGLVNTHSHAPMTLLRGYAENMVLQDWLNQRVFPFEAQMTPEDIYNGSMLAFAEMLRFGTVSVSEMYFMGEAMGKAVLDSGIRCNLSLSVTCQDDSDLWSLPIYQEMNTLLPTLHNAADGRLKLDLSLHAEYTSTPKVVAQMARFAKETGMIMQLHLSETEREQRECVARHGVTPAAYFEKYGIFESPTIAAHCVWLTPEDREILAKHNVSVASCPASNLKLASGLCQVQALLDCGANVTLGTDGPASNNALNQWSDLKLLASLSKVAAQDPTAVPTGTALKIVTANGAKAQGRADCGVLKEGNRADLIVLNVDVPWMQPVHSMENNLVYAAQGSDVVLTMVDGTVLYRDGEYPTIDIEKIQAKAKESTNQIIRRLS